MRASFSRFDAALIDRVFQPLADSISDWIGLDRLRVAGLCLDAASVAWIVSQAEALSHAVTRWEPAVALPRFLLLLLGLVALSSLRTLFRRTGAANEANPLRLTMLPHRGIALALLAARLPSMGGLASVADLVMLGFAVCALYLGACGSRPVRRQTRQTAPYGAW